MSMSFSIRIVDSDGDPRENRRVTASFGMSGNVSDYTDEDGWANFETSGDYTYCDVYVDGENQGEFSVSDGETMSLTVDPD